MCHAKHAKQNDNHVSAACFLLNDLFALPDLALDDTASLKKMYIFLNEKRCHAKQNVDACFPPQLPVCLA